MWFKLNMLRTYMLLHVICLFSSLFIRTSIIWHLTVTCFAFSHNVLVALLLNLFILLTIYCLFYYFSSYIGSYISPDNAWKQVLWIISIINQKKLLIAHVTQHVCHKWCLYWRILHRIWFACGILIYQRKQIYLHSLNTPKKESRKLKDVLSIFLRVWGIF